ncbi:MULTISPECIES: 4Fe-4S dicluster domain-containing protein [Gordonibacter]|uniref:Carboxypeptidase regulatory-like domain-containing protein n=1 Tax=Gordonibacter faecis TaxID=3047475 RepID=A0ABT7DLD2_9ACTN|nr:MULTISPECIES: 4Fe-4S dicluster domain-containing protein [unclassified Gordonibacter]MDJ1650333.1 carboxypeptidase regulatory-like domain-containing protein [Gordonibacter sp. KGMB12511]HIW76821.1 carboxypeptidase regulatory-like domain-containing protein [Candidatus Gordonibacter avicola]
MAKTFLIDIARCNGCRSCQVACKDEHCGADWAPYAAPQPDTGQFWIEVDEQVRGSVPKVKMAYTPHSCRHCADAPCLEAGRDGAVYRRDDGLVIIDPERARGQRAIVEACPFGAVFWNEALALPQKCTGCAHLLEDGWSEPRCVDACPTGALRWIDEEDAIAAGGEALGATDSCTPRTRYLNVPKRFVAGEAYDREADEELIGCTVTLLSDGTEVAKTTTDDFGDFWFHDVEPGLYRVRFEYPNYLPREVEADVRTEDRNIGGVALASA